MILTRILNRIHWEVLESTQLNIIYLLGLPTQHNPGSNLNSASPDAADIDQYLII